MTTNQTIDGVPRELIERVTKPLTIHDDLADRIKARDELRALLDAPAVSTQLSIPYECPHMIVFDDTEREHMLFAGAGARYAALKTWDKISTSWNAHLFVRVERNSRDDRYPSGAFMPSAKPQGEPVAPWFYFVECDDPDYSGLFNHESEAQTQANDHGGVVVKLWNVPPTCRPATPSLAGFWQWLDTAYRDGSKGEETRFTKYNMEVAYSAGANAEQPAPVAVVLPERLAQILKFLEGAENLDGYWFGEPGPHGSKVWWRAELRKALAETNLFAKQQ
ncbi:hypothetical protein L9Z73_20870 [Pseudomonas sp. TNT11]|uniref:DUF1963 domain-containing protein n=1 Tax=Pseudomonas emilianonis TaxID=2915812 RepID=A0ABT0ELX4_9PSED|nr:hypothetical protein [Pseudomonas emilianonis]MCK1786712.1 hypothetical protein [Pseudomonas emilianonis]